MYLSIKAGMRLGDGSSVSHVFRETEEPSPCLIPDRYVIPCTVSAIIYHI